MQEESESAAMFRAFSTRGGRGYEKLSDEHKESSADISLLNEAKMSRARSVPAAAAAKLFNSATTKKQTSSDQNVSPPAKSLSKQAKKASKLHPLFSLFDIRSRKKATANPEFSRYIQYLKEGGILNANSNKPTMN